MPLFQGMDSECLHLISGALRSPTTMSPHDTFFVVVWDACVAVVPSSLLKLLKTQSVTSICILSRSSAAGKIENVFTVTGDCLVMREDFCHG